MRYMAADSGAVETTSAIPVEILSAPISDTRIRGLSGILAVEVECAERVTLSRRFATGRASRLDAAMG